MAVLGKGHEQGQTIGDTTTPFDDAQVLRARWADIAPAAADSRRLGVDELGPAAGTDREVHA